jgi:HD-GYP domain-containing protein (c-di-GMP phosphodiesterase class II)
MNFSYHIAWGSLVFKQISKYDLKLGMYIHDLNCDWMKHPFMRGSFMLREESDLELIQQSPIDQVWIDTMKGLDTAAGAASEDTAPEPPAPESTPGQAPAPAARPLTSHLEELPTAKRILREASRAIHSLLTDARLGRQIHLDHLQPVVLRITGSILRNPGTLVSLCRLREADKGTFQHSVSSCALLILFGHRLTLDETTLLQLGMAGMLHDLGKMRVPDHILNKPGKLTDPEYVIMRDHVRLGLETLGQTPGVSGTVLLVAAEHHERCDGSGYPKHLQGDAISLYGRMAAIVDVYDAVTSKRIYHHHLEPAVALRRLYERSPRYFDQDLVQQFIQAIGIYPVGSLVRLESNRLAVVMEQNQGGLLNPKVRVVYDLTRGTALSPFDLDLSRPEAAGEDIVSHEEPAAWNLDTDACLNQELRP